MAGDSLLPQRASLISSTRRTETPARYILMGASSTLQQTGPLICPLITYSFSCTIFSDMVYRLLSEWYVLTLFYQMPANHVSFYLLFNLRNLSCLIHPTPPLWWSFLLRLQKGREAYYPVLPSMFKHYVEYFNVSCFHSLTSHSPNRRDSFFNITFHKPFSVLKDAMFKTHIHCRKSCTHSRCNL